MKQILNINLGGHPVTIDTDAYDHLSWYLDTIEKHFKASEATEEILFDIETRMAELFKENIHPRTIVTMADVNSAIDIMGTPEMFGAEVEDEDIITGASAKKKPNGSGFNPGKRLFRDAEEKVIGGVASGLAAYLGIADPISLRIAFVVFTVAGFASIPIYVILWIAMPVAKSSADRLAMKGEPINVQSIANSVSEEFENLSEKFNTFGSSKKKRKDGEGRIKSNLLTTLGGILSTVILGISHAARPFLKIVGGILIVFLILSWVTLVLSSMVGISQADFYMPTNLFAFRVGVGSLFLLVAAPIMGFILRILRVVYRSRPRKIWVWGLVGLWGFGWLGVSYAVANISKEFKVQGQHEQVISMGNLAENEPLKVNLKRVKIANNDARKIHWGGGMVKLEWGEVDLEVLPAKDGQLKLIQIQKALGGNGEDANNGANNFEYEISISKNNMTIPSNYFIPKGERFRAQKVRLKLFIPIGKKIILGEGLDALDLHLNTNEPARFLLGKEVIMTDHGLALEDENLSSLAEVISGVQVFPVKDFNSISISGDVALHIQQGDIFRVKVRGLQKESDIDIQVMEERLMIMAGSQNELEIFVTMPSLEDLTAKDVKSIAIAHFHGEQMELDLEGDMEMKIQIELEELTTQLRGNVNLVLFGSVDKITASLSGESTILGSKVQVQQAAMEVKEEASAVLLLDGDLKHYGE